MTQANGRTAEHPIAEVFLNRWSPRAFTGEEIPEETLLTFIEAARWSPSAFNMQPWRFIYARRGTPQWERLFGILNAFNQSWAGNASALIIVLSKTTGLPPGQTVPIPNVTHTFDAGAAWGALALQATLSGWQAHGMVGIDKAKAMTDLAVPADYVVEAAIAIGRVGDKALLPEALRARETPSQRVPLREIAMEGSFQPR